MKVRNRIKEYRMVKASELRPSPKNWRTHPKSQQDALRAVLADVGYADALLARETKDGLELIDGHLRAETTPDEMVPVLVLDVTEQEAAKILATLDPLAGLAEADSEKLASLMAECDFDSPEINAMIAEAVGEIPIEDVPAGDGDEMPEREACEQRCASGDLWIIDGKHRLLIGDCTSKGNVRRLMDGVKPFMMVTDPPYGVEYDPNWRKAAAEAGHLSRATYAIGKVANDDRADWSEAWNLFDGDIVYTWSPPGDHVLITGQSLQSSGFSIRAMIMWKKSHFAISRGAYHYQHEPCWYAVRKGRKAHWCGDRSQSTVWDISHVKNDTGHGTQKPVECMARPMRHHGGEGDVVYDPFLGSGTSMIAAHRTRRICYGCEIEPTYGDIILTRCESEGMEVEKESK